MKKHSTLSHPLWLRLCHWLNAIAVMIMVFSGWQIYNASPVFKAIHMPQSLGLGGWLAGGLLWHFAGMWLLFFNGLFYLAMNIITGRFKSKFWPLSTRQFFSDILQTLRLKLSHDNLKRYNMIQKLMYLGIIGVLILLVLSGLVMWKQVQFPLLRILLGGYDSARVIHFICMSLIVLFTIIHVFMVMIVPRTLKGMIFGRF